MEVESPVSTQVDPVKKGLLLGLTPKALIIISIIAIAVILLIVIITVLIHEHDKKAKKSKEKLHCNGAKCD